MQIITNQFQKELKKHGSDHFPFLVSYQCLSEYDSNSFMWHCHPEIEITYVKEGSMHYRINNRSFHLKEGDIIFCNSNALHSGEMENQEDCSYIPITFDPKLIYGFFQSTICTRYVDPVIQNLAVCAVHIDYSEKWHETFRDRMLEVISLDKKKPDFYELDISIRMQLLWRLLVEHLPHQPVSTTSDFTEYERIRRNTGSSEAWNISIPKNPSAVLLKKPAFPIPIIIPKYSARLKDAVQENTEKI